MATLHTGIHASAGRRVYKSLILVLQGKDTGRESGQQNGMWTATIVA